MIIHQTKGELLPFSEGPELSRASGTTSVAPLRPIHYLGSKLRILPLIAEAIATVAGREDRICDLFAGSGTVGTFLSRVRPVVSADIQEYSRVLCSATLNCNRLQDGDLRTFVNRSLDSKHAKDLFWATDPLIQYEEKCVALATVGELQPLCQLIEEGSMHCVTSDLAGVSPDLKNLAADFALRLRTSNLAEHPGSTVTRYFGGVYYSYRQSVVLDCLLESANREGGVHKDLLLAMVLSTASELVNTVGKQFAQPIRPRMQDGSPKATMIRKACSDRSKVAEDQFFRSARFFLGFEQRFQHKVIRGDFREVLNRTDLKAPVIYADPPYTRDHYSRYYHVLETMCLRDNPRVSTVTVNGRTILSRGIYRADRHQSPFCIKTESRQAFIELFSGVRKQSAALVLSYSPFDSETGARPRVIGINQLLNIAREHFKTVEVLHSELPAHAKLGNSTVKTMGAVEVLIVCRN